MLSLGNKEAMKLGRKTQNADSAEGAPRRGVHHPNLLPRKKEQSHDVCPSEKRALRIFGLLTIEGKGEQL